MPTAFRLTVLVAIVFLPHVSRCQESPFAQGPPAANPFGSSNDDDPFGYLCTWDFIIAQSWEAKSRHEERKDLRVGDPLPVAIAYCNSTDSPEQLPLSWYKNAENGGPAILNAVSLSLHWAPFDANYPTSREFVELKPTRTAQFEPNKTTRTLKPRESCELLSLDLRDWFHVDRDGHYLVCVRIDWKALGIPDRLMLHDELRAIFTIGEPPKLPTIEQYNKSVPIFGGLEGEKRLRQLIRTTVKPAPSERGALPDDVEHLLQWSEPMNGLSARIEYLQNGRYQSHVCFIRLKNVSDQPLTVPTGNPCDKEAAPYFDVYVQHGAGPWRRVIGRDDGYIPPPSGPEVRLLDIPVTGRPWATLLPGEDCVGVFEAWSEEFCVMANRAKIVLRQPDTSTPGRWSGVLETSVRAMELSPKQTLARRAAFPFPKHFPSLNYDASGYVSAAPSATTVDFLNFGNLALIELLEIYELASVCTEFEQRMRAEEYMPMKLLLASIAAPAGSEEAALFLLEMMKDTDYLTMVNARYALQLACERYPCDPPDWQRDLPDWLVELCLAAHIDRRFVTGIEKAGFSSDPFPIASEGDSPLLGLMLSRARKAVPTLVEWAKMGDDEAISALGYIGGERAIAALTEMAQDHPVSEKVIDALCGTRDKRAVPTLIDVLEEAVQTHMEPKHNHPIWAFGQIGDERAVPILVKLLEKVGESEITIENNKLQPPLSALAETLGKLKAREAVPQLLRFAQYPEIINSLRAIGDPAALPALSEIATAKGKLVRRGREILPELEADRYFAARMALCTWDDDRGAARLIEMLNEEATAKGRRDDLVKGLARCRDPKVIPPLVAIVKSAEGRSVIRTAIAALGDMRHKAAVEGLIECFDVDFKEEHWDKGYQVTPAIYRNDIASSLRKITGRSFGTDKQQWLKWWQEEGQYSSELK